MLTLLLALHVGGLLAFLLEDRLATGRWPRRRDAALLLLWPLWLAVLGLCWLVATLASRRSA